ncbi:MAG TPA: START-like domain-containing protein [Moheibacter sp.]|nr:START-like domain-containing protein [Moheibacter sp.]
MTREKFQSEFVINASPSLLYNYISNPSGLSEWFADNVNSRGEKYTFIWDGDEQSAFLVKSKQDTYVRFQWEDDEDTKFFFELTIVEDDLTGDVSLMITDFADSDEVEEAKLLWESQIDDLKKILGS